MNMGAKIELEVNDKDKIVISVQNTMVDAHAILELTSGDNKASVRLDEEDLKILETILVTARQAM